MDLHTLYRHDALPIWLVVGFAAETGDVEANARAKLAKKKLDLIAANRVSVEGSGFESDDNALVVYWNDGQRALGPAPKTELADQRSEEHTSELQSLMRSSYAVFCLKKNKTKYS